MAGISFGLLAVQDQWQCRQWHCIPVRRDSTRARFQLGLEQWGQRAGKSPFLRAGHSQRQRTHLKSLAGSAGWASNTTPGGSLSFCRAGFPSNFLFFAFMVVLSICLHHEAAVNWKPFSPGSRPL